MKLLYELGTRAAVLLALAVVAAGADRAAEPGVSPLAANPHYTGSPFVRTWLAEDYGAHPTNHSLLLHPRTGLLYVGNQDGVLEFDGERWRLIRLASGGAATWLTVDRHGRIWGCSSQDLFRLEPDERGQLQAQSQRARLKAAGEKNPPERFSQCVATTEGVYATDRQRLWLLPDDGGPAQVWRLSSTNAALLRLWAEDDAPHVVVGEKPGVVVRRRAGAIERLPPPSMWGIEHRDLPDGSRDYLTFDGIYRRDAAGTRLKRYPSSRDPARAGVYLPDGRMVLAWFTSGLSVCDAEGRLLQQIGRADGLPANAVNGLALDRQGGVWVALSYGLARLQLDSPYARHGPAQGLHGTVHALARHDGRLHAGGTEGLFAQGDNGKFAPIPRTLGTQRDLFSGDGWLFIQSPYLQGLRQGEADKLVRLENRNYYGLVPLSTAPGWFVAGANDGLRWGRPDGDKWEARGPLREPRIRARALLEAPAGFVWAHFAGEGVWRVDFRGGLAADAPARRFDREDGLPESPEGLVLLGGEVVAAAEGRLLRFDAAAARFVAETRVAGLPPGAAARVQTDAAGTVWILGPPPGREIRRLVSVGHGKWRAEALPGESARHLDTTALFHDADTHTLWIGGHGGTLSRDLAWQPSQASAAPAALVRRIESAAGELLAASSDPADATAPAALAPATNSLRISFAAPAYAADHNGTVRTEYRTRLDGLDATWTAWSRRTDREFTNLPWRDFVFRVQARDDTGRSGPEATAAFAILPPWWATRWAWAGYGVIALGGVAGIVRLRTRALHRRADQLEAVVAARTRELAASNAELARLNKLELDEKIAAQLAEEKARLEVLRYQLNPHFLYNSLNSIYGLLFGNAAAAGDMVLRLSDFCRATLAKPDDDLPTLETEMAALRSYLDVEQAGWGDKLQVEFVIAPEAATARLPPFLLLPIVENAIKYGHRTSADVLRLKISARHSEGILTIEIANSGAWVPPDPRRQNSTGIGLENLRQRLRRHYPEAHDFTTEEKDGYVVARLRLAETGLNRKPATSPEGRNR